MPENESSDISFGFTGNFPLKMDSTQRVAIPAKFKEVLDCKFSTTPSTVVLVPDDEKVKVLPIPVWMKFQERLEEFSDLDPNAGDYKAYIIGNMRKCTLDGQNRIQVPQSLCELANLQKEVVVVGQIDKMEIWDAEKWKEFNARTQKNLKSVMSELFRNRQLGGR